MAKVHELMALVDELETQLATARTTATQLLQAAVTELTSSANGASHPSLGHRPRINAANEIEG